MLSLAMPDICSALEDKNGKTDRHKYKKWFNDYVSKQNSTLSGEDCYQLRCSLVHNASLRNKKLSYSAKRIARSN